MLLPEPLRPGDRIRVVAPSGPFDRALVLRGLGWLSERYEVRFGRGLFTREGFLAGSDAERLAELAEALADPDARAVLAARGGYGLTRITPALTPGQLLERPRWLVGFSDVTALHAEAWRAGLGSLHADNLGALGRADARRRAAFVDALERPLTPRRIAGLAVLRGGQAAGPLVGGNLTVLHAVAAAGRLALPAGAVLFLEDVAEAPYRVDRMLTSLVIGGLLDRISAVVLGDFTDCPPGRHGVPIERVLEERLGRLHVPVLAGLRAGHGAWNEPLVFGARAEVDADVGALVLGSDHGRR